MEFVQEFFKTEKVGVVEYGNPDENRYPLSYQDILELISKVDIEKPSNIYFSYSRVEPYCSLCLFAEILDSNGITMYKYYYSSDRDISVLAKIISNNMLLEEDICSVISNNQIVIENSNTIVEAEYLAFCVGGVWYRYKDRRYGKELISFTSCSIDNFIEVI